MGQGIRQQEKEWHEELFRSRRQRALIVPKAIRERYSNPPPRPLFYLEQMFRLAGDVRGKRVLAFGCGDDYSPVVLALQGAEVWAFDLSCEAIQLQQQMARENGVQDRLHPVVCAAEELPFTDNHFDLIFGSAILHHIPDHLPTLPAELFRILRKDGFALFSEPVLRNSLLKWVLEKLPGHQEISPGERQLTDQDLSHFFLHFDVQLFPFCFLARLDRFLLRQPLEYAPRWMRATTYGIHGLDYALLRMPLLDRLAGVLVLKMRPKMAAQRIRRRGFMLRLSHRGTAALRQARVCLA